MKKICLTLGLALLGLSMSAQYTRTLYKQTFESGTAEECGWTCPGPNKILIAGDAEGKYLEINNNGANGRSATGVWGSEIYLDQDGNSYLEDGVYKLSFSFCPKTINCNQYNGDITVFTNQTPVVSQPFRNPWTPAGSWDNFVFDMHQNEVGKSATEFFVNAPFVKNETTADDGTVTVSYSIAEVNSLQLVSGNWYTVEETIDTESRQIEWSITNLSSDDDPLTGVYEVPGTNPDGSDISMFAEGMHVMCARTATVYWIDDILITCESATAFSDVPSVALTGVGQIPNDDDPDNPTLDLNARVYTITFNEAETLHVIGTDGVEEEIEFSDCDGRYTYIASKSGTLTAWTSCDDATSAKVTEEVDCSPCELPAATSSIVAVEAGFAKTYMLSVDNATVPLRPNIFINYVFKGKDGSTVEGKGEVSGARIKVPGEGTLTLTTQAFGYQETSVSVENNIEYVIKKDYDFARMSDAEITAAGFPAYNVLNSSSTSGFNNWTARKRLFYYDLNQPTGNVDDAGNPTYVAVYPFGFIAEDNTTNVIEYAEIGSQPAKGEYEGPNVDGYQIFEGLEIFPNCNVSYIKHVGIYNNTTYNNNNNINVLNLDPTDVVVVNIINNYGGNSCHPIVATVEEYYAQLGGEDSVYLPVEVVENEVGTGVYSVTVPVYRIDTTCSRLAIYAQKGAPSAVEGIEAAPVVNGDGKWYNLQGIQVAEPNASGIYIHNGKKVLIRK